MKGKYNKFRPNESTTRWEYVLALYNAAGTLETTENCSFTDVSADTEYAKAVAWAEMSGITTGNGDGTFMPNDLLTREMAITFLYRALPELKLMADIPSESVILCFSDNELVSSWALEAMNTLVNMSIINGTDEGKLNPQGNLTNAEVATIIYKVLDGDNIKKEMPVDMLQDGQLGNRYEMPEMTEEEKVVRNEQIKNELTLKLDSGEISQEEYDEMIANIENENFMVDGRGMNHPNGPNGNTFSTK